MGEPDGLLFADGPALYELTAGILAMGWPARWGRLAEDGAEDACLRDLLRGDAAMVSTRRDASRWLPLAAGVMMSTTSVRNPLTPAVRSVFSRA